MSESETLQQDASGQNGIDAEKERKDPNVTSADSTVTAAEISRREPVPTRGGSLMRRIKAPVATFLAGLGIGVPAGMAVEGHSADSASRPPDAAASPAPGFAENTPQVPGAQVAAGTADLSLSEDALKALGKEQKLTELREKYGMVYERTARLSNGAFMRVMSDADIFTTGSDEEFKTSMDTLFNAPFTVLDHMPDSPYKKALVEAKAKADKGAFIGREVIFAIPSDPKRTFVDGNDPFGSTADMPQEFLSQRSPTGLLLGEKGPSPVLIFALNAGSADGSTVTRTLNGEDHIVPVAQYLASQIAHEWVHVGTRAAGIPFKDNFAQQEKFGDEIQAALLENPSSLPTPFRFSSS